MLLNTHRVCCKLKEGIRSTNEPGKLHPCTEHRAQSLHCTAQPEQHQGVQANAPRDLMALCPLQRGTGSLTFSKNTCCHSTQCFKNISAPAPGNRTEKSSGNKQSTILVPLLKESSEALVAVLAVARGFQMASLCQLISTRNNPPHIF